MGFPAGQATDIIARTFSDELGRDLGQNFIVENRPGAGSMLSAQLVMKAPADGYTLMWGGSGNLGIAPYLYKNAGYNPVADFDTLMVSGIVPMLLVVNADSEFKSFDQLLKAIRSRPLNYGSGGSGVTNHLATELLKLMAKVNIDHVPYKGDAPALQDLIGGQFNFMFASLPACIGQVRAGRLRALAVSTARRLTAIDILRDVPAVSEHVPNYECVAWTALVGPKGLAEDVKVRLAAGMKKVMQNAAVTSKFEQMGNFVDPGMTIERSREWIRSEGEKFSRIISEAKVSVT
ncbi:tripartite tricarboxylate transporter substrate-binding protein [Ramlibacter tataouinensis]|uniref:Bug family tripartite tricarboxylate transporter substrate binding protein n=1 Tax=Ramlibacter tataouinensis TaxID=94132 RepID=UPI0022F397D9|nr:tripartite tricarboxylate transporter substrate-binding protein [Ramlibacter tataouinensis]WBY01063.1 tripartite tricarboxylate transporter substrate-binding protein [Ramlibacter tataouinensis]